MPDSDDTINSAYALARKSEQETKNTSYTPPPDREEVLYVLDFLKAIHSHTKDWFASILEDRGIGHFRQSSNRPFNRNLLFIKGEVGDVFQIYSPCWLDEIKRCHLQLWSAADNDPEVKELYSYVQSFKHEWEDFFQELSKRFPDAADNLLSDFETAGLQMFGNLDASISYAHARTPDAKIDHDVFLSYLPKVKKIFAKESRQKNVIPPLSTNNSSPSFGKLKTAQDIIEHKLEEDRRSEQEHLKLLTQSLLKHCIFTEDSILSVFSVNDNKFSKDSKNPEGASQLTSLISIIRSEIQHLRNGNVHAPSSWSAWQSVLPLALTYPANSYAYGVVDKEDDDPSTFSEILESGERVYIRTFDERHPLEDKVKKIQELTSIYLRTAFKLAKKVHSKSEDLWAEALGKFNLINHAFLLPDNKETIEEMSRKMVDAASRLAIDLETDDSIESKNNTARKNPIDVRVVDVAPSAGKGLRAAMKDPGGRPPKTHGGAAIMTQADMAKAFGSPCTEDMVNGWEARAAGKKRGANPPDAIYNDERIIYSAELRLNPTPDNKKRLTALIAEFQSRHRIKDAIGEKALHMKSVETLAKASGHVAAAIRDQSQLKYGK